jgi:hypothetical protein
VGGGELSEVLILLGDPTGLVPLMRIILKWNCGDFNVL